MTTSRPSLTSGAMTQNCPGMDYRWRLKSPGKKSDLTIMRAARRFNRKPCLDQVPAVLTLIRFGFLFRGVITRLVVTVISTVVIVMRLFDLHVVQHHAEDVSAD